MNSVSLKMSLTNVYCTLENGIISRKNSVKEKLDTEERGERVFAYPKCFDNRKLLKNKTGSDDSVLPYTMSQNAKTVEYVSSLNKNVISTDKGMKCQWGILEENPHTRVVNRKKSDPILPNILHSIGNTKLVRLNKIPQSYGLKCEILAKCEFLNPGGSVKDRASLRMIENAEKEGLIKPGFTIIEATSGNTGIGVAMAAAVKGYRCIIIMNDNYSLEKVSILKALGAEVVRVPSTNKLTSPDGCLGRAMRLKQEIPNSIILDQFSNPGNSLSHYDNTAEEILDSCGGKIDMLVCVTGTGGTVSGVGRKIKERSPLTKVIALDSHGSVLQPQIDNASQVPNFEVEGMGNVIVPPVMDYKVVDKWFKIGNEEAFQMTRRLIREEGLLVGGTSGASVAGAIKAAKYFDLKEGQRVVVILSDNSRNYLSRFVCDNWMEMKRYKEVENVDHWWWNHTVSSLNLNPLKTVADDRSIAEVFDEMRSLMVNEILVVDKSGQLSGVCDLKTILQKINENLVKTSDAVVKVTNSSPTVRITDSLGLVARILEIEHLVAVVHEKDKIEKPYGIIRQGDILNFIIHKSS